MVIFKTVKDLQEYLQHKRQIGSQIGFVPTMGALHAGHISLVQKAKNEGAHTVCSIFINPTQFNDKNDFEKYPISVAEDVELLLRAECDVLFLPDVEEVYPGGSEQAAKYDFDYLDTILEGAKRPGHFGGVGQVVARLLNIVQPDSLFMGQKDYQQCMVVSRLIGLMGKEDQIKMTICPTTREQDGLAMSSRNRRLTAPQRVVAATIYQCLVSIQSKQGVSGFDIVKKECEDLLAAKGFTIEYVALANAKTLQLLDGYTPGTEMVVLIAAWIGDVRLIDNMVL